MGVDGKTVFVFVAWVFACALLAGIAVAFAIALGRLPYGMAVGVGAMTLAAVVLMVALQAALLGARLDVRDLSYESDPEDRMGRRHPGVDFTMRSYSLIARPDLTTKMGSLVPALAGGIGTEVGAIVGTTDATGPREGMVSRAGDVALLVVARMGYGTAFAADVDSGTVGAVWIGGSFLRVSRLTGLDIPSDVGTVDVGAILRDNDVYLLAGKATTLSPGSAVPDILMPTGGVAPTAVKAMTTITGGGGDEEVVQVWGVGSR